MIYPESFIIANQKHTVEFVNRLSDDRVGEYDGIKSIIRIAKNVLTEEGDLESLSEETIENTFWHELFHAFQTFYNNDLSEANAQVFANFMREFFTTANLKIVKDENIQ
jgi:hypothetical protein